MALLKALLLRIRIMAQMVSEMLHRRLQLGNKDCKLYRHLGYLCQS
jgi:hypothetical protein